VLLADLEKAKCGAAARPRAARPAVSGSRHIPAAVRREVWKRDRGQCAFVGTHGRCSERGFLEFHHLRPYADGGATVVDNLELRCRAHNVHEAERCFGDRWPLLREARAPA
jgi:5-methylcytosine-specific restriction endonuclease McrA